MSDTISISASAWAIFCSEESLGWPPKRKDILGGWRLAFLEGIRAGLVDVGHDARWVACEVVVLALAMMSRRKVGKNWSLEREWVCAFSASLSLSGWGRLDSYVNSVVVDLRK